MSTLNMNDLLNSNLSIHIILDIISKFDGLHLLNVMNQNETIYNYVVHNMKYLIQSFITVRPYEKFIWEHYENITIDLFKRVLMYQQFVISEQLEHTLTLINNDSIDIVYGQNIDNERKLLYGFLYYNIPNYISNIQLGEQRLKIIITEFDDFTNDMLKFYIKIITIQPKIGNMEYIIDDVKDFYNNQRQDEFIDYLTSMTPFDVPPHDILMTFNHYNEMELELFKEYIQLGINYKYARFFILDNIIMTDLRKEIYFALYNRVNFSSLVECINSSYMRNLEIEPLSALEEHNLYYELEQQEEDY